MHGDPKFPVANADPKPGDIMANMNFSDIAIATGITVASGVVCFTGGE